MKVKTIIFLIIALAFTIFTYAAPPHYQDTEDSYLPNLGECFIISDYWYCTKGIFKNPDKNHMLIIFEFIPIIPGIPQYNYSLFQYQEETGKYKYNGNLMYGQFLKDVVNRFKETCEKTKWDFKKDFKLYIGPYLFMKNGHKGDFKITKGL